MSDTTANIRAYRASLRAEQEAQDTWERASQKAGEAGEALNTARQERQAAYEALMADIAGDIVETPRTAEARR